MCNVISFIPSRTGIAIGRLLNAQLRHMLGLSLRAARRHTSFFFGHRYNVGEWNNTVWFYKVSLIFPSHFHSLLNTLLMPVRILLSL